MGLQIQPCYLYSIKICFLITAREVIKMKKLLLIFRNITKLIKIQKIFLVFLVISQIIACLSIFFSIGAIHNTRNEQKDIDIRTMYFEVYTETTTLGDMHKKAERVLSIIPENLVSYASIRGYTDIKYYNMSRIYGWDYSYFARLRSIDNVETEQIRNGEKVTYVKETSGLKIGDKTELGGIEYTVISVGDYVSGYCIPITALNPDLPAHSFRVDLSEVPEKAVADEIQKAINEVFPVTTESHAPEIPDLVSVQFNRTMIITSAIVITVVVFNLSYCYCYLFIQRKKMLSVYMMCGSSNSTAANLMIAEAVIISAVCYLISVCLIKPFTSWISEIYPAAEVLYSVKFFTVVSAVYIALTAIILKIMFTALLKKSAVELKRGV